MRISTDISNVRNYDGIPSVTGILSLLEFESLDFIKNSKDYESIMREAANRGTYVHKYIENDLTHRQFKLVKKHSDFIRQWIIYKYSSDILTNALLSNISLEQYHIFNGFGDSYAKVAGTIDYTAVKGIEVNLKDWKTSSTNNINYELLEKYKIQMGGYALICIGDNFHKFDITADLIILNPKGFNVIHLTKSELSKYKNVFVDLLYYYYDLKRGILPSYINTDIGQIEVIIPKTKKKKNYVDEQEIPTASLVGSLENIDFDYVPGVSENVDSEIEARYNSFIRNSNAGIIDSALSEAAQNFINTYINHVRPEPLDEFISGSSISNGSNNIMPSVIDEFINGVSPSAETVNLPDTTYLRGLSADMVMLDEATDFSNMAMLEANIDYSDTSDPNDTPETPF